MNQALYRDRIDAGKKMIPLLEKFRGTDAIVIGLPRGGIITAYEISKGLQLTLDILVPRKLGVPNNPELAMGAIAGNAIILNEQIINELQISEAQIAKVIEKERIEAKRRRDIYRKNKPPLNLESKQVLLVDDGIATGATMHAAIAAAKDAMAYKIVVAVPVGPPDTIEMLKKEVDEVICPQTPASFMGVSQFYELFEQTTDEEIIAILGGK